MAGSLARDRESRLIDHAVSRHDARMNRLLAWSCLVALLLVAGCPIPDDDDDVAVDDDDLFADDDDAGDDDDSTSEDDDDAADDDDVTDDDDSASDDDDATDDDDSASDDDDDSASDDDDATDDDDSASDDDDAGDDDDSAAGTLQLGDPCSDDSECASAVCWDFADYDPLCFGAFCSLECDTTADCVAAYTAAGAPSPSAATCGFDGRCDPVGTGFGAFACALWRGGPGR